MKTYTKHPDAVLDYVTDWSDYLGTDTLSTAVATADEGLTVDKTEKDDENAVAWLSGGTDGETYGVYVKVTTAGGRTDVYCFAVKVEIPTP
jgi:hypothetical protein